MKPLLKYNWNDVHDVHDVYDSWNPILKPYYFSGDDKILPHPQISPGPKTETKKALPMTPQMTAKLDLRNSNVTMVYEMSNI